MAKDEITAAEKQAERVTREMFTDIGDGPVFPILQYPAPWGGTSLHPGLTQLDFFAAYALNGAVASGRHAGADWRAIAADCYRAAEAMIEERQKIRKKLRRKLEC